MNRGCLIPLVIVVLLVLLLGGIGVGKYNSLVAHEESIAAAWSQIDNQYKRRYDLIPQVVETVKGVADFEQETLQAVTDARASVGQARLPDSLPSDPAQLQAYMAAQQGLGSALGRLFAVSENYPQLGATQSFRDLQTQIEGTENRIAVARTDYIQAVRTFNTTRRKFPGNVLAGFFGFEEKPQLEFDEGERERPEIDLGRGGDG